MSGLSRIRKVIGWGAAIAALLPFAANSVLIIHSLAVDGLKAAAARDADPASALIFGAAALVVAGFLLTAARLLLRKWPGPAVYLVAGMVLINAVQIAAMFHSLTEIEKCGYPLCLPTGDG